jgi:hypothetical protein
LYLSLGNRFLEKQSPFHIFLILKQQVHDFPTFGAMQIRMGCGSHLNQIISNIQKFSLFLEPFLKVLMDLGLKLFLIFQSPLLSALGLRKKRSFCKVCGGGYGGHGGGGKGFGGGGGLIGGGFIVGGLGVLGGGGGRGFGRGHGGGGYGGGGYGHGGGGYGGHGGGGW